MKASSSWRSGALKKRLCSVAFLAAAIVIAAPSPAPAGEPVTEGKYYVCLSEQWLDDFTSSAVRNDHASVTAFLTSDKCLVLKPDLPVTIVDEPTLPGTRIAFTIQGFRFYAPSEEIIRK